MQNNMFKDNLALYGNNIGSYPTKITLIETELLVLQNISSGKKSAQISFLIKDQDD